MQITNNILMIRPTCFKFNTQTADNNFYQRKLDNLTLVQVQHYALNEFNSFVDKLRSIGVNVIVVDDFKGSNTPDSIFPNNWVSFHKEGTVCIYPMFAKNRRDERREDIFDILVDEYDFTINEIKDFTGFENEDKYLEGTGSMVLDRENKICYASISERTDEIAVMQFCDNLKYRAVCFAANQDIKGIRKPIYHTNVMMTVADKFVVICLDAIDNLYDKKTVISTIFNTGKEIIEITEDQKLNFAGNMLQVMVEKPYMIMSESAFQSLTNSQRGAIEKYCPIIHSNLDTIEACGGGSARCMMAEVFLPKTRKV